MREAEKNGPMTNRASRISKPTGKEPELPGDFARKRQAINQQEIFSKRGIRIMARTLLKNIGCLYSGDINEPVLKADSILIEDGKIVEIGNGLSAADARVIDVKGTTVMPGLMDSHTHPVIGEWTPRQGAMSWIDPYVRSGVTGLISVGETHIPGKPKTAKGRPPLAPVPRKPFTTFPPPN